MKLYTFKHWSMFMSLLLFSIMVLQLSDLNVTQADSVSAPPMLTPNHYVATNGNDSGNDCADSNNPCQTIQHAIDEAVDGDTVQVDPGIYTENINFNGKNIVVRSLSSNPSQTVIDGNQSGSVVTFENGEDATAVLKGFTITNGSGTFSNPSTYSPTSYFAYRGGGIYLDRSSPSIVNVRIIGNSAELGGGIHSISSEPTILDTIISDNTVSDREPDGDGGHGGGIYYESHSTYYSTLTNVLISGNTATNGGGIYANYSSRPVLTNVTITGNTATNNGNGGAIWRANGSGVTVVNSIIWNNNPALIYWAGGTPWTSEVSYSDIEGGPTGNHINWGSGNLDVDPQFVNAAIGDFRLSDNSPLLAVGTLQNAPATDLDGYARPSPAGSNPDMGAYESRLCIEPPDNMVAWWHLDEITGTLAADIAMLPNDGTHMNNPTAIVGVVDGALSFAGTQQANQYVEVPDNPEIDFGTGDLSIDAWIRTDSNQHLEIFIDKREDRPGIGPVGYSFHLENGRLAFQLADDPNSWFNYWNSTGPDLRDGKWHFVAATVDRDQPDGLKLYIDGTLIEAFDPTNRSGSISNDGDLWIGKHHANSALNRELWFDGDLDEVEFFDRVLDPSEIKAIYQAGSAGKCKCVTPPDNMVAWWHLDEMTGTLAADIAMYPNDGTHMNSPTPIGGVVAGGLSFAGTQTANQYVNVPDHNEIDFDTGDISIDAWIRTDSNNTLEIFIDKRENRPTIGPVGYAFFLENGRLSFQLADSVSSWLNYSDPNSPDLRDGQWHFVAATVDRDQSTGGKLYVDGNLIHTFNPTSRSNSISNDGDLWIGKHHANSAFNRELWFDGDLDEVELFDRALDASEIRAIYKAGSAGKCKGRGAIHGQKFHDLNGNGVKDDGEPGLEGWTILLRDANGNVISTVTDASGNYWFMDLPPGTYTVSEAFQAGWMQTHPASGSHIVTLAAGEVVENIDFGNWQNWDEWCHVGWDINHFNNDSDTVEVGMEIDNKSGSDATYQVDVIGYPGFVVTDFTLTTPFDGSQPPPTPPVSVANGSRVYVAVFMSPLPIIDGPSGQYQVIVTNEATGHSFGCSAQLWQNDVIGVRPERNVLAKDIVFGAAQELRFEVHNIADRDIVANIEINQMFGAKGQELDIIRLNDQEPGQNVIEQIVIPQGEVVDVPVKVQFDEHVPQGVADVILSVDVDNDGQVDTATSVMVRSVEAPPFGSIHGMKFHDLNGNGVQDAGEPGISGVTIVLTDAAGNTVATTTTAADGSFSFDSLPPGSYTVSEVVPDGWQPTTPASVTIELSAGGSATVNFGNAQGSDSVQFAGLEHQPLGLAELDVVSDTLVVSNIGSSGEDGVSVELDKAHSVAMELSPVELSESGDSLALSATGTFDGNSDVFLGEASFTNVEGNLQVMADYTSIGTDLVRVEVWDNDIFVGMTTVPAGIVGNVTGTPSIREVGNIIGTPSIRGGENIPTQSIGGNIIVIWPVAVTFTASDESQFVGDELRFLAASPSGTVSNLSSFNVQAANIDSFTITNEAAEPVEPRFSIYLPITMR